MPSPLQKTLTKLFNLKKIALVSAIFLLLFFNFPVKTFAQSPAAPKQFQSLGSSASLGVARLVEIKEKDVKDGQIITSSETGAELSTIPYDGHVLGVIARDAAIVLDSSSVTDGIPVMSYGQAYVLVSTIYGPIKKGNLLTTTTIPGVAAKAIKSGYVIGTALEDYEESDPQKTDKIVVEMDLHYFNSKPTFPGSLTDILKIALLTVREGPSAIFKYIMAAIVVLGSFTFGFLTFGRTAAKGVEALGRNPAAKGTIQLGIIFNISIVAVIILTGLTVAFLILRL